MADDESLSPDEIRMFPLQYSFPGERETWICGVRGLEPPALPDGQLTPERIKEIHACGRLAAECIAARKSGP